MAGSTRIGLTLNARTTVWSCLRLPLWRNVGTLRGFGHFEDFGSNFAKQVLAPLARPEGVTVESHGNPLRAPEKFAYIESVSWQWKLAGACAFVLSCQRETHPFPPFQEGRDWIPLPSQIKSTRYKPGVSPFSFGECSGVKSSFWAFHGGGWVSSEPFRLRATHRHWEFPLHRGGDVGFRCFRRSEQRS